MSNKPILKRGISVLCSCILVFSLAATAFAAELPPEDTSEKIVVGMVIEVTGDEVTLEVRESDRGCVVNAPEQSKDTPEGSERPEDEPASSELLNVEPSAGEPANGSSVNTAGSNDRLNKEPGKNEFTLNEGIPTSEHPVGETPQEPLEGKRENNEELPAEPEEGTESTDKPEVALEEGEEPLAEPEFKGIISTLVLNINAFGELEPEVGDVLRVVIDTDGTVVSVELLQMDAILIDDNKEAE